jgi:hypothetical protein
MVESSRARSNVAQALFELRSECGLPITSNVKQCLRVLLQRLANCPEVVSCQLSSENVVRFLSYYPVNNDNIRSNAILDLIVIIQKIFWGVSSHFSDIYKRL